VGGLNDLLVGVLTQKPSWEQVGSKLTLGMPRRHVDDEAFEIAINHALKGFGDNPVMPALDEGGPDILHKTQKGLSGNFPSFDSFQIRHQFHHCPLIFHIRKIPDLAERLQVNFFQHLLILTPLLSLGPR